MGCDRLQRFYDFNPRSRMGSDQKNKPVHSDRKISIHAPAWGATNDSRNAIDAWQFQSTLPHGERPDVDELSDRTKEFNPRSRMGSDSGFVRNTVQVIDFNPRSRMGSDRQIGRAP